MGTRRGPPTALNRLELDAWERIARRDTAIVVYFSADVVVLGARRFDEYEMDEHSDCGERAGRQPVLRVHELAPDPTTRVIANGAGAGRAA